MSWYLYRLRAHRPDFAQTMTDGERATMMAHIEYGPLADGHVLIYSAVADLSSWRHGVSFRRRQQRRLIHTTGSNTVSARRVGRGAWWLRR